MDWRITRYGTVTSTNDLALQAIRAGAARAGDVIVAAAQRAGRGRRGRTWLDGPGALLMTAVLPAPGRRLAWCGAGAALAVAEGLGGLGARAGVKWPNDVVLEGRKVAGILVEIPGGGLAAVGMGINVNNPVREREDFAGRATSVSEALGRVVALDAALAAVVASIEEVWRLLEAPEDKLLLARWERLDTTPGRSVRFLADGREGLALRVAADGTLSVRAAGGEERVAQVDQVEFLE